MQVLTQPSDFAYAPCYCEENVWHLAGDPRLGEGKRWVLFVSNPEKSCAFWCHRAAEGDDVPVVWDYHVVLLLESDAGPVIFDLDSTAGFPMSLAAYLMVTFPHSEPAQEDAPRFGIVDARRFRDSFASDRSHMRDEEGWLVPPPDWPPIGKSDQKMNLFCYVDMHETWVETCLDAQGLKARFSKPSAIETDA